MHDKCLGPTIGSPTIIVKKCPRCGEEVELFSDEKEVTCTKCGFTVCNE